MQRSAALMFGIVLAGCGPRYGAPRAPLESTSSAIIGGVSDSGDSGVVLLYAQQPGADYGSLCTAEVIAPTVLLTAAHCVSADEVGEDAEFHVFLGSDLDDAQDGAWVPVREVHHDEAFDSQHVDGGHDVGIVILAQPVSIPPLAYSHAPIADAQLGQKVRLVGYGLDNARAQTGSGIKRQTTTSLMDYDDLFLHIGDSSRSTCNGDSGGPAFMTVNGVPTIVGITSFGNEDCTDGGYDTRIDRYSAFIDAYVKAAGGAVANGGTPVAPTPPACSPDCTGKRCGDDGCGGLCGTCDGADSCAPSGQCESAQPPSSCDNGGWERESNDSRAQAGDLCIDPTTGQGSVKGTIDSPSDVDWYGWQLGARSAYTVTLADLPADYTMSLYKVVNGSLAKIADAEDGHDGQDQTISYYTSDGGTYFVRVYSADGSSDPQYGYLLSVLASPY